MPLRCRSCDSSRPDGPPPMMQTWVFMAVSSRRTFLTVAARLCRQARRKDMDQAHVLLYKSNMRGTARSAIRSYNLFGETSDVPDVIHCETIAARSVLHDWELEPHRHARLHQVLLIARGGGEVTIEGQRHRLRPMQLVNVPTGQVHGFSFRPERTAGW